MSQQFFSMAQAAQRYGLSYKTIQKYISDGTLPCTRFGRTVRIPLTALEQWEKANLQGGQK